LELLPYIDFAQAILPHKSIGFVPYKLELGFKPRLHFNWEERIRATPIPYERLTRQEAQAFIYRNWEAVK